VQINCRLGSNIARPFGDVVVQKFPAAGPDAPPQIYYQIYVAK
jgi:hypothetical protein